MNQCALRIAVLVAGLVFVLSGPVLAHGTKNHDASETAGDTSTDLEQMPWGIAGSTDRVDRTIEVSMLDKMRFDPEALNVQLGQTIKFIVRNEGKIMHEFVLGTQATNDEHAALMVKFPGMEHDAPYMAHVEPGMVGEVIWTFNKSGNFKFACLIAGHYQAGMVGSVSVLND
ncbi:MAG: plastocyanin/azurin family copper-binding protein [Burkholderiaceae bacterium]